MPSVDPRLFGAQTGFVEQSLAGLQTLTALQDSLYGLGQADWQADLQRGTITFTGPEMTVVAPVQIIGTYDTQDGSWLWGWEHPSVPATLAAHARLVRDFAAEHRLTSLLPQTLHCTQDDIWAFAALATRLASAQGAYRGPAGNTLVMMTYGELQLSRR